MYCAHPRAYMLFSLFFHLSDMSDNIFNAELKNKELDQVISDWSI